MLNIDCDYKIEKTKDGYDILKIQIYDKNIYLGSKYNMKNEIDKFLNQFKDISEETIFVVCGFGAGGHIKALREKYRNNVIMVFEPINKLKDYIENINWVKEDEKIEILYGDKNDITNTFLKHISVFNYNNIIFSSYNRYSEFMGDQIREFLTFTKIHFVTLLLSHNTRIKESKRWFKTLMSNLKYMIAGTPINEYENCFENKPAIIVSSGPSLDKNIDELKNINNDFVLFTGYRNIDGLLKKQINPTFVSVIDSHKILYDLGKQSIPYTEDIPLIFYEGTNDLVVKEHKGKKIFFTKNEMIKKICGKEIIDVPMGGSVAHGITNAAIIMGCNPIIFVGQDLAYTGEKSYSESAANKDGSKSYEDVKSSDDVWVEAFGGGKVRTSLPFQVFIDRFEAIIRDNENINFINATEGGARIHGTTEMNLKEAMQKYRNGRIEADPNFERPILDMKKRCIEVLDDINKKCKNVKSECKKALSLVKKLKVLDEVKNFIEINNIFKKLDKIDKIIKENYDDGSIIESLLYPVISEIMGNKIKKHKYSDIIEENNKLYSGILQQVEFALDYICKYGEEENNE